MTQAKSSKSAIKDQLGRFLRSGGERFKDYDVFEFGDVLVVSVVLTPDKVGMHTCELCGYFTPYHEELHTHRMTHIAGGF